jgi:hypothetical protein
VGGTGIELVPTAILTSFSLATTGATGEFSPVGYYQSPRRAPFRVVRAQAVYRPGDVTEVPAHIAADWLRDGWVSPVE